MPAPLPLSDDRYPSLRAHPCRYPDARDPHDRRPFLFHHGHLFPLTPADAPEPGAVLVEADGDRLSLDRWLQQAGSPPIAARIPVLAVGSNAYPRQLADKFHDHPLPDDAVPVLACTLTDLRLVFCAHLAQHGYIPVTLRQAPGHTTHTWLQWLTAEQLETMAKTEGPYALLAAVGAERWLRLDGIGQIPPRVLTWWHHAALDLGPGLVAFAGNPSAGLPGDPDGLTETALLHRVVAQWMHREGSSLAWDGCTVPADRHELLRRFLHAHACLNPPPPGWTEIDHQQPGFTARVLADIRGE